MEFYSRSDPWDGQSVEAITATRKVFLEWNASPSVTSLSNLPIPQRVPKILGSNSAESSIPERISAFRPVSATNINPGPSIIGSPDLNINPSLPNSFKQNRLNIDPSEKVYTTLLE